MWASRRPGGGRGPGKKGPGNRSQKDTRRPATPTAVTRCPICHRKTPNLFLHLQEDHPGRQT